VKTTLEEGISLEKSRNSQTPKKLPRPRNMRYTGEANHKWREKEDVVVGSNKKKKKNNNGSRATREKSRFVTSDLAAVEHGGEKFRRGDGYKRVDERKEKMVERRAG